MNSYWRWLSLCLVLIVNSSAFAQNAEVKNGIQSYEAGDFPKALQYFQIAINAEAQLKGNKAAEAYLYRAKTRTALLKQAAQSGNEEAIKEHQHAMILAFQDLVSAGEKNEQKKLGELIDQEKALLYAGLLEGGAGFLDRLYQDQGLNSAVRNQLLDAAQRYLSAAIKLQEDRYSAYNWYGQVMMLKRDNESAQKYFQLAIEKHKGSPPTKADLLHFNIFANLALLDMQERKVEQALQWLEQGKSGLQAAHQLAKSDSDQDQKLLQQQFDKLSNDFEQLELDIYLHSPEHKDQAIEKFKAAVAEDSNNFNLRIAYANLLEAENKIDQAVTQYQKAAELAPKNFLPQYNIGVIYLKQAAELQKSIEGEADSKKLEQLKAQYQKSLDALEKAHQLAPKDLETLKALVLVTGRLEMKEAYLKYRNLKRALQ